MASDTPMSREGAGYVLVRLRDERKRIAAGLLDLADHPGHKLLGGARLTGETRRQWDEAQARVASLWQMFDAYGHILDRAERLRGRQARLGPAELEELTWLLTGPSVEPPRLRAPQQGAPGRTRERLTPEEVAAWMARAYEQVVGMVTASDAAWSVLLPRLDEVERAWRAVRGLRRSLGTPDRERARDGIGRRLAEIRKVVLADPLSLVHDGTPDTAGLDRLSADLTAQRRALEEAARRQACERTDGG